MKKQNGKRLLAQPEDRGYPSDFLISRVRGRRARLIRNWKQLALEAMEPGRMPGAAVGGRVRGLSPDDSWKGLLREYRWIYARMDSEARRRFAPFFLYAELRTITVALRQGGGAGREESGGLLAESLLADDIKAALLRRDEVMSRVQVIENAFRALSPEFAGLTDVLKEHGLRGVEQKMAQAYLAWASGAGIDPVIRSFFRKVIDARNLLSLFKEIRFDMKIRPRYLGGGNIAEEEYDAVADAGDMNAVLALIRKKLGISIDVPDITKVERALYQGITRRLKSEARDLLGAGVILDYLWRCSIEAMNLSVLAHTKNIERQVAAEELVQ